MTYVDGFVIAVPKRNLAAYRRMSKAAGKVWKDHGALEYRECAVEDLDPPTGRDRMLGFRGLTRLKRGETVIFAWITYKSRAHRDRVNKKVMKDPRMATMMTEKPPFGMDRFAFSGFDVIVDA